MIPGLYWKLRIDMTSDMILAAIISRINASTDLSAEIQGIHYAQAPEKAQKPYVLIQLLSNIPVYGYGGVCYQSDLIQIEVIALEGEASTLCSLVDDELNGTDLELTSGKNYCLLRRDSRIRGPQGMSSGTSGQLQVYSCILTYAAISR